MATKQLALTNSMDFSFLDVEEFKAKFAQGGDQTKACFFISGISCGKCIRKIEQLVESTPGLKYVRVEMGKKLVHIEFDPSLSSLATIAQTIANLGFDPIPMAQEQDKALAQVREERKNIVRLAVAGACAGNIMTFAFAIYFGAEPALFAWLSFLLYLPVVTYVAIPFYQGAYRSIRQRQISIDLPMAVASLAGFLFSTIALLRENYENIYFDSISGFLFLILVSRFAQRRLQSHFLEPRTLVESLKLDRVRVMDHQGWHWRPIETLAISQRFKVQSGETLPADAQLLNATAKFSLAWLTGEAKPKTFFAGSTVPAGSQLLSSEADLSVSKTFDESGFGQILNQVNRFVLSKNASVIQSDRWAQWLLFVVFAVAASFLVLYWHISPEEAIQRSLALIVLACPCAMAFGTPLALAVSLKKAAQAGLIIKDGNIFENVRNIKTIFFDKTGTLTETDLTLTEGLDLSDFEKGVVLGLENLSYHPIAFAFRKAFGAKNKPLDMKDLREIAGFGVRGSLEGNLYELKRSPTNADQIACSLYVNGVRNHDFRFESVLKPNCEAALKKLKGMGYRLKILSGDSYGATLKLSSRLGFNVFDIDAEQTPQMKADVIKNSSDVMMVGDGINDSLALMNASVGVAASGGVGAALKSADVYLTEPNLDGVVSLIEISHDAFALIRQNLIISVFYNSIGGALALGGFINPFIAAILMPISSGFILISTWLRSRI